MPHYDLRPLQIRIARLEDKLNKDDLRKRSRLFGDPSKVIAIAAFIISIVTTAYSWRKDHLETQLANRKQLNETIQQLIDTGIKTYEFSTKNKSDPTVANLSGWFNAQTSLMANRAGEGLAELKNGKPIDYIMVGNALLSAGNTSKATLLFKQAIQVVEQRRAQNTSWVHLVTDKVKTMVLGGDPGIWGEDEDNVRLTEEANAYLSLGNAYYVENNSEAAAQFERAIRLVQETTLDKDVKDYRISFIQRVWSDALVQRDCGAAKAHVQTARDIFPSGLRITGNFDWNLIEYTLAWLNANCGPDGHIQSVSASRPAAQAQMQPFGMSPR